METVEQEIDGIEKEARAYVETFMLISFEPSQKTIVREAMVTAYIAGVNRGWSYCQSKQPEGLLGLACRWIGWPKQQPTKRGEE